MSWCHNTQESSDSDITRRRGRWRIFGGVEEEVHYVCPASAGHKKMQKPFGSKRYGNLSLPKDTKTFQTQDQDLKTSWIQKIRKLFGLICGSPRKAQSGWRAAGGGRRDHDFRHTTPTSMATTRHPPPTSTLVPTLVVQLSPCCGTYRRRLPLPKSKTMFQYLQRSNDQDYNHAVESIRVRRRDEI